MGVDRAILTAKVQSLEMEVPGVQMFLIGHKQTGQQMSSGVTRM
jgi:hypothetical protein